MEDENQIVIIEPTVRQFFPPLIKRFQSLIIDQVFIILCMVMLSQVLPDNSSGVLKGILLVGLFFIYEPFCMAFGCTLGNYVCGIRVRKFGDEDKRINIFNSYLRYVTKLFLGLFSFFTVTANKSKRAIHDMAAGSIMIYADKKLRREFA